MLSDDLETLAAHVIDALGANKITTQSIVRRLRSYAEDARRLESACIVADDATMEQLCGKNGGTVVSLDRARKQQLIAQLASQPPAAPIARYRQDNGENDGTDH